MTSLERSPLVRLLVIVLLLIAALFLAQQVWALAAAFGDIILLFFLAWLVGFMLSPLAKALCGDGQMPRPAAVALVYLGLILALVLAGLVVIPAILAQLSQISSSLPQYAEQAPGLMTSMQDWLNAHHVGVQISSFYSASDLSARIESVAAAAAQNALGWATGLASLLFNIIIVLVLSFYFVLDGERIAESALRLVPDPYPEEARTLMQSVDRSFGGFLRGQTIQAAICGIGTAVIMLIAGLDYVLLASVLTSLAIIIPFIGPFLGLAFPLLVGAFQLPLPQFLFLFTALLVLQQVVFNVIAPKVVSDAVGMHPLLVFLALLVGMKVAGMAGAIFGIPVAAVINAMIPVFYRRSLSIPGQSGAAEPSVKAIAATRSDSLPPAAALARAWKALEGFLRHG